MQLQESEDEEDNDGINELVTIDAVDSMRCINSINVWTERLVVQRKFPVIFKLDSGSQVNVLSEMLFNRMNINTTQYKNDLIIKAYGGFKIEVLFKVKLDISYKKCTKNLEFVVVKSDSQPLLGLDGCVKLKLIQKCKEIDEVSKLRNKDEFLQVNSDIFKGIGVFPDKYTIKVNDNSNGVIKPLRRLPRKITEQLKFELESLVKKNIIEKVEQPKNWASNLVVVEKDNKIRICLDPIELNKDIKI